VVCVVCVRVRALRLRARERQLHRRDHAVGAVGVDDGEDVASAQLQHARRLVLRRDDAQAKHRAVLLLQLVHDDASLMGRTEPSGAPASDKPPCSSAPWPVDPPATKPPT